MPYLKSNRTGIWTIYRKADSLPAPVKDPKTGKLSLPAPSDAEKAGQIASPDTQAPLNPTGRNMLTIIPGLNPEIPQQVWDEIKDSLDVKQAMERGELELVSVPKKALESKIRVPAPVTGDASNLPGSLEDIPAMQALEMVKSCSHEDVLKAWLAKEDRKGVAEEIAKQLEALGKITNPPKNK